MKTNKQIKRAIASVTGGEWMPDRINKPQLHHALCELFGGSVYGQISRYHKPVSIKAEDKQYVIGTQ